MPSGAARILIVADHPAECAEARQVLKARPLQVCARDAHDAKGLEQGLADSAVNLVVAKHRLDWCDSGALVRQLQASHPHVPVIVFADSDDLRNAVDAMRTGAADYVRVSAGEYGELVAAVERILACGEAQRIPHAPPAGDRSLLDTLPVAAARTTPDGRFIAANEATAELFGFPDLESLLAARVEDTYAEPQDRARLLQRINRDGVVRQAEVRCRRCDGSELWAEVSVRAVRDADGDVVAYDGAYQDISQRKQLEARIREQASFRKAVIECADDGLCVCHEIDGPPHVAFTVWNDRMTEITGYTMEQINEQGWYQTLYPDPELQQQARGRMDRMRQGDDLRAEPWRITDARGRERVIEISTSVIDNGDETPHVLALMHDATERIELEAALLQAQKLEVVGQLAGGMAHDFNNLLTGIVGYTELAAGRLQPGSPEAEDLREVRQFADRATSLTRRLLTFSRRQELAVTEVDASDLLADAAHMLGRLIEEDIEIELKPSSDSLPVLADRNLLTQALFNLARTGRDAMPHGGKLTLRCGGLRVTGAPPPWAGAVLEPGEFVELSIRDTGSGMDAETLAHALEPFFTTKRAGEGTGLGLSITLGIVRQHGGDLSIESRIGEGTRVRLLLPSAAASATGARKTLDAATTLTGSETILVVEDEPGVREVMIRTLEANGYDVLAAADSEQAVKLHEARPGRIALLLSDVILPGEYGPELFARLAAVDPDLRVLFVSGYTAGVHGQDDLPAGALLLKPFGSDSLLRAVRGVLDA